MNMKKRLVACLVIVALLCSSLLPAAAAEETDLLVNGGFETGDSTGWNWFNNAVVDSAAPHSGNYCAKVAKNSSYEQVVTVSPDTKYVLTGWAKSEGSSVMTLGVKNYGGQETFSAIPISLEEAARIDGCSLLQTLFRISIPLATPGIASTAILSFIFSWNEFLFALLLTRQKVQTAPIGVLNFIVFKKMNWGVIAAGAIVIALPVIFFGIAIRKYYVKGLTQGGLAGD